LLAQAAGLLVLWRGGIELSSMKAVSASAMVWAALTLAVLIWASWKLMRTVRLLVAGAARFAAGDLHHWIAVPAGGEMCELAQALNDMAGRLNEQIELLRAQSSEQRIIHQSMSTGMIALDQQQRVLSINRAAENLLAIKESQAKGRLLRDVLQEPELNRFVSQITQQDKPTSAEFALVGNQKPTVHAVGEPLRNTGGAPVGLLIMLNDVTRLRRLEAMRSDFAANVSHELRTPITNIMGYVETLLEMGTAEPDQTAIFLAIIKRNTERLASIIEDLLALSRLEQADAQAALDRTVTPLYQIIQAVSAQFETARAEKKLTITVDAPTDLVANVNAPLLEQALGNLLSNAIKFSPPNTTIVVRAGRIESDQIEIAVADQGPGIVAEHLPRIFERFYRVDRARSRKMGGTGLGLAIVKHIAMVHGGRVDVQSQPGHGSVFRIVLPQKDYSGV
jgi:two-component system phosphate regulon sensor histidine kinase PhoR